MIDAYLFISKQYCYEFLILRFKRVTTSTCAYIAQRLRIELSQLRAVMFIVMYSQLNNQFSVAFQFEKRIYSIQFCLLLKSHNENRICKRIIIKRHVVAIFYAIYVPNVTKAEAHA